MIADCEAQSAAFLATAFLASSQHQGHALLSVSPTSTDRPESLILDDTISILADCGASAGREPRPASLPQWRDSIALGWGRPIS